ncbi:MAG: YgeY family selenium metabolism-linked hydrolase [Clostridiales bacterium]|jgi:putative selenium metabolism hydrolase|nr:YgeY family selenium metabolism-linked hydrolase [Clostridiales bacterium]
MDFEKVKAAAEDCRKDMAFFLRELIKIPGTSSNESEKVRRVASEMKRLGFDRIETDPMGNLLGYMGSGQSIIAFDGHIDTVGVGNPENWTFDPFEGFESEDEIGGRGASDQLGGIVSAVYGAKIMKDLGLIEPSISILVSATVQEEDCDGLNWQYIINEDGVKPEFVVITEPTDGKVNRGQRGRMEIRVDVRGVSCHGSAPERGENAIYRMCEIIGDLKELGKSLKNDSFLGKGTLAVSEIFFTSPSRCAVPDSCSISIDRRLTTGETWESALEEIKGLPSAKKYDAQVSMYKYDTPSCTGLVYPTECFFPTWVLPEEHPAVVALVESHKGMYGDPVIDKWTFSTNGVSIMGRFGIACIGFGPGKEIQAHAPDERTWKDDLVKSAAVYAALPSLYLKNNPRA